MVSDLEKVLQLSPSSRTIVVGESGSGKTTLAELMVTLLRQRQPKTQCLYIDSKPRFRAEYELNGLSTKASRRYRKWDKKYGETIPGSYVLPLRDPKAELEQIWRLGGHVAIAQTNSSDEWGSLMAAAEAFYEDSFGKVERLVYVNELSDFFEVKKIGGIFWLIARSGREKKVSLIAETQRPVYVPKVVMTESVQIYLFKLKYLEDMKRMWEMGIPRDVEPVKEDHTFFYWHTKEMKRSPSGEYYRLRLQ